MFKIRFRDITLTSTNIHDILQGNNNFPDWEKSAIDILKEWFGTNEKISFHSSGSTGKPKEITFSREQVKASAKLTASTFSLSKEAQILLCLHPKYVAGKMMILRAIINHWQLDVVEPSKSPAIETQYDLSAMVPMQIEALIENNPKGLEKISKIIIGGAPISEKLHRKILTISPSCFATFGMTETLTHVAIQQLNKTDAALYFEALQGIELNQDSRGCVNIRASHLSKIKIQTNDVVRFVDFGKFVWLGRYDNVINSGGVKIHPEQLEKSLAKLIDRRLYILGQHDEELGQKVVLYIEGKPYDKTTFVLLKNHLKDTLSKFEVPKEIVFVPKMRETVSGKVIRIPYGGINKII